MSAGTAPVDSPGVAARGRGRRPAAEVRSDALRSVGSLLLTEGLAAVTFERVARESGVSRTTLSKWWPSTGALALDGYFHAVEDTLAFADTGDVRADVTAQLRQFVTLMTTTPAGRVLLELIGRSQTDPELSAQYRQLYSSGRRRLAVERFRRARDAGQLRPDVDLHALVDQLWGAVYHRLLVPDEPVDLRFADALIANVFGGVATSRDRG